MAQRTRKQPPKLKADQDACIHGHTLTLENTLARGGCKTCKRISSEKSRRARGAAPRVVAPCEHGPDRPLRPNRNECAICHRDQQRERDRAAGAKPRGYVPDVCPKRGHPMTPENMRTNRNECATCHRMDQCERYKANIEEARRVAREYARSHSAEATARHKAWRHANPVHVRSEGRKNRRARHVGRTQEGKEYIEMLRADPCSYCGGPAGTLDHVEPIARGGENIWQNLTAACLNCNMRKHDTPLLKFMLRMATGSA